MPNWLKWLIGALVIVVLAVAVVFTAGIAGVGIGAAFGAGFAGTAIGAGVSGFAVTVAAGAFAGAVIGAGIGLVTGGLIGGISSAAGGGSFWQGFADGAASGFMMGAITGAVTGGIKAGVGYMRSTVVIDGKRVPVYRGGNNMELSTADQRMYMTKGGTRGISVNSNPADANIIKYGGPHRVASVPRGLKIVHTAGTHFEIVPKVATMSMGKYQILLNLIKLIAF